MIFIVKKMWLPMIMGILVFALSNCAGTAYTNVKDIDENPDSYLNQEVFIKGVVIDTVSLPFVDFGVYRVYANGGSVWIYSENIFERGKLVEVKGMVKNGLSVGDYNFATYIEATEQEIVGESD